MVLALFIGKVYKLQIILTSTNIPSLQADVFSKYYSPLKETSTSQMSGSSRKGTI